MSIIELCIKFTVYSVHFSKFIFIVVFVLYRFNMILCCLHCIFRVYANNLYPIVLSNHIFYACNTTLNWIFTVIKLKVKTSLR